MCLRRSHAAYLLCRTRVVVFSSFNELTLRAQYILVQLSRLYHFFSYVFVYSSVLIYLFIPSSYDFVPFTYYSHNLF